MKLVVLVAGLAAAVAVAAEPAALAATDCQVVKASGQTGGTFDLRGLPTATWEAVGRLCGI